MFYGDMATGYKGRPQSGTTAEERAARIEKNKNAPSAPEVKKLNLLVAVFYLLQVVLVFVSYEH